MSQQLLIVCLGITAFLYASVGHGGASGYLAFLALAGFAPGEMKSSALILNCVVSAIALTQYFRQHHFKINLLWPFAVTSVPAAFAGSFIHVDDYIYKVLLALCLFLAVLRILNVFGKATAKTERKAVNIPLALFVGAAIGFLSGMLGIGGGILLSPFLLILNWANMKEAAASSAGFILVNSLAGLTGAIGTGITLPASLIPWILVAVLGGVAGSYLGSARFNVAYMRYTLGVVLLFACFKLITG